MSLNEYDPPELKDMTQEEIDQAHYEYILHLVVADYDRRVATRRGRFLLWLLRKTT